MWAEARLAAVVARWLVGALGSAVLALGQGSDRTATDYALRAQAQMWLRHPVLGDPSFDNFERSPGNPIHRGAAPFEWPVNGFLFADPVAGNWYLYVGDYCAGYAARPSRCLLYRSADHGITWRNLGPVLEGDPAMFDKRGHTPDVSVVYAEGRYHMVYDWGELDFNREGGLAYAWAERPEGPFHRAPTPITRNSTLTPLLGRYQRTYAATLARRRHDWLIVGMMDHAPSSWALFTMTAPRADGPYGERHLVRHVEAPGYHAPLLEFYPAFVHRGYFYAPATSVALNRNFNVLFRVPLERATEPGAWETYQHGSVWHSAAVEHESYGLWGQTFAGWVSPEETLWALFPSRDAGGFGTINLAHRPWGAPLRERGFVLSGHQGPSFTCLRRGFRGFRLETTFRLRGTARWIWNYEGVLGPDKPQSDATLHELVLSRCAALELAPAAWRLLRFDPAGQAAVVAQGAWASREAGNSLVVDAAGGLAGGVAVESNGQPLWRGSTAAAATPDSSRLSEGPETGVLGLWVGPRSHLEVEAFRVHGTARPAWLRYHYTEALLGAGERLDQWEARRGAEFHCGVGAVARAPSARAKWNVTGQRLRLWSPCGPDYGRVELLLDGRRAGALELRRDRALPSRVVWTSPRLTGPRHALVMQARDGRLPLDCLEVED